MVGVFLAFGMLIVGAGLGAEGRAGWLALAAGVFAGCVGAWFDYLLVNAFGHPDLLSLVIFPGLGFLAPFFATIVSYSLAAHIKRERSARRLAQEHDGGAGGDEGEA